jgi:hypothetical protein
VFTLSSAAAHPLPTPQGRQVIASPSYDQGRLEAALTDSFLRLEERMQDPAHQAELYNLKTGEEC